MHTAQRVSRALLALVVAVATLFTGFVLTTPAHAEVEATGPGLWANPGRFGSAWWDYHGEMLGVYGLDNGQPFYCIETGVAYNGLEGQWQDADDPNSLIAATMIEQNKSNGDGLVHAGVSLALKQHFDHGVPGIVDAILNGGFEGGISGDQVRNMANQLWNTAAAATPQNATVQAKYTKAQREGTVEVWATNMSGGYAGGVPFRMLTSGPIQLSQSEGVTSANGPTVIHWVATGNGDVSVKYQYNVTKAAKLASPNQDMIKPGASDPRNSNEVSFRVVKDFQPTVTTQAADHVLDAGKPVVDNITSGVKDSDPWVDNTPVTANGYYYTGTAKDVLKEIQ